MTILMYITVALLVFLFLMFIGMNARIGILETIVAFHVEAGEEQVEFNKGVIEYHNKLDEWLAKVEGRLDSVESTSKRQ